jgi:biopolymer transport protein ExbD
MRNRRNRNRREELTPEMTPLMDIMFLLLIFFIVTSVFRKNESILALSLPKIEGGVAQAQKKELMTMRLCLRWMHQGLIWIHWMN